MKKLILRSISLITIIAVVIFISDIYAEKSGGAYVRSYAIVVDNINPPYLNGEVRAYPTNGDPYSNCTFSAGQTTCTLTVSGTCTLDIYSCAGSSTGDRINFTVVSDTAVSIYLNSGTCPF